MSVNWSSSTEPKPFFYLGIMRKYETSTVLILMWHVLCVSLYRADQALSTLAMRKFCEDKVSSSLQPSQNRSHFSYILHIFCLIQYDFIHYMHFVALQPLSLNSVKFMDTRPSHPHMLFKHFFPELDFCNISGGICA